MAAPPFAATAGWTPSRKEAWEARAASAGTKPSPTRLETGMLPPRILRVLAFLAAVDLVGASLAATVRTVLRSRWKFRLPFLTSLSPWGTDIVVTPPPSAQSPSVGAE